MNHQFSLSIDDGQVSDDNYSSIESWGAEHRRRLRPVGFESCNQRRDVPDKWWECINISKFNFRSPIANRSLAKYPISNLIISEGYKKFQTVGLTGYHLLHLSTIDIEKGSKINLVLACKCVRAMLLDEKFRILGDVDVRVQSCTALIFTFTSQWTQGCQHSAPSTIILPESSS